MDKALESIHNLLLATDSLSTNNSDLKILLERIEEILKSSDKHGLEYNIAILFGHDDEDLEGRNVIAFIKRSLKSGSHFVVEFLKCIENLCLLYPEILINFVEKIINISKDCALLPPSVKSNTDVAERGNNLIRTAVEVFHTPYNFSTIYDDVVKNQIQLDCIKVPKVYLAVFKLVGVLSQFCPDSIQPVKCDLLQEAAHKLAVEGRKPEEKRAYLVVEGSFEAINGLLFLFTQDETKTPILSLVLTNIYNSMKLVIDAEHRHRHSAHRVAFSILENHTEVFLHRIKADYIYWHEALIKWIDHKNKDDKEISLRAQNAYLRQMARLLANEQMEIGEKKQMLEFFFNYLRKKIAEEKNASNVAAAVEGIGVFAPAFATILDSSKIEKLFEDLVQKIDSIFPQSDDDSNIFYLSEYLGTLAAVGGLLNENLKQHQLENLERISVKLISACNTLSNDKLDTAVASIAVCCLTAFKAGSLVGLKNFINLIVYQGIIKACCQQPFINFEETTSFKVVIDDYMPFWEKLLSINNNKKIGEEGIVRAKEKIVELIYEAIIESIVKMINNLDVNFEDGDNFDEINVGGTAGLKAHNDADMAIVMNLEFLFSKLLPKIEIRLHEKYISFLLRNLTSVSTKNPLLPSYYKLLATVLCIAEKLGFFEADNKFEDSDVCQKELNYYIGDLLVNLHYYHKDIQEACLRVITSSSVELIATHLQQLPAAFKVLFHIGRSDLELSSMGVSAIDRWMSKLSREELTPFFKQVIPYLYPFLDNRRIKVAFPDHFMEYAQSVTSRRSKHVSKRRKLVEDFRKETSLSETELTKLQQSILMLLGRLDMTSLLSLLDQDYTDVIRSWTRKPVVSWEMKFRDLHVLIDLDVFAPRAMEIALQSSDPANKDASFELLHAIFVIFLANTMNLTHEETTDDHIHFLRKILPGMFKLGCKTSDPVGRNIFNNLMKQACHWYARKYCVNQKFVEIFVDSLLEALTCPTDIEVREFAAECLQEYVAWTIKPTEEDRLLKTDKTANVYEKTEYIISKIIDHCFLPCPFKRQGVAMGFNRIYRELRKQRDDFWMSIFHQLFNSLAESLLLPHPSRELFAALDHISLLWIERRNSPRKKDEPKAEVSDPLLLSLVSFLFNNANNPNEKCREKFMGLITQLVVELKDINSLADFVAIRGIHEDEKDVTNKRKSEMALMSDLMLWLDSLSGSVHKFKWLKENKVDVASVICSENNRFLKNVNFYISEISSCSAGSIDWLTGESSPFCPQLSAIDAYDRSRCRLTLHILSFLSSLEEDLARLADFFQKDVWQWLSRCLVGPAFIGFTAVSQNQLSTLRSSLSLLLSKLVHHCGNGLKENFVRPIITSLEETECCQLATGLSKLIKSQAIAVKLDSLNTLIVLKQNNLLDADDQDLIKDEILWSSAKLICTIANCLVRESLKAMIPDKSQTLYLELLLDFAFLLQPDISTLIECMCDETLLKYEDDDKSRNVILGQHFTNTLNEKIFGHLCKFPTECVVEFLKKFPKNSSFISNYLCTLLDRCRNCENSVKLNIALKINSVFPPEPPELDSTIPLIYAIRNFLPGHNIRKSGLSNIFNYLLNGLNGKDRIQRPRVLKTLLQISFVNTSDVQNTPTSQEDDNLLSSLKKFMSNNFPTSSKEWGIDSHWYMEVFNILLEMIKRTGNKDLVLLVTDVMAADIDHPFREKLKDILGRPSTLKNNSACVLDELYKRLANKGKSEVLIEFVQDFMLPIIQAASLKMAEEFFLKHIKDIVVLLKEDNKNVRMSSTNLNNSLSTRAASMLLIGALFSKFPSSDLTSIENPIVQKSEEIDKNKNDAVLLRNCTARVIGCLEDELREATRKEIKDDLYLSYKQIAFNTLVILISNTKRDAKDVRFYVFLFKNIKFTMPRELISISNMVFDEIPKRKKALIGIRRAVRAEKRKRHYSMSSIESHQLFTQSMESSTFADDICKYNFSNVHMREHEPSYCDAEDTDQMLVELEADHLNNHPCMPPLCGMIMNLHKITTDATPSTSEGTPKVEGKPDWIKFISDALQSSSTTQSNEEINAKLLLIKLLHNCNETNVNIFSPYAKHLLPAIINFIIENKVRCFGNKMNYMIGDVLGMLTSWSAVATPNNVEIYQLLSFLFEKTPDDRKDVMKLNIETVKTVISSWKDNITTVPHETVLDFLTDKTSRSKLQSSLEIICCLLNCNIKPYADENLDRFYKALKNNAFSRDGSIRKNSAEILGMLCRFLTNNDGASVSSIEERFDLKKLAKDISLQAHDKNDNTGGLSNMILFVSLMKNHYPRIVTYFIKDTVPLLSKIHGSLQQHVLGIVNTALELDKEEKLYPMELYLDVKCKLLNIFRLGDVDNQETALKVVLTLRHFINDEDLGLLMQEVVKHFSNHSSLKCRKAYYDVLVTVYEYYQITPSGGNMELSSSEHEQLCAKDLVTNALVSGLEDSNEELRNQLFQFWNNEERLQSDLVSRLEDLFKLLYKPDLESSFLSLFLELLLTVCKLNPAYYSCIFSDRGGRSTDQSEIVDMKLSRVNSASVAPILIRTVSTKHQSSYSSFAGSVGSAASFRSTQHQSLLFKPSVDADAPPIPTVGSSSLHSFAFDATVSPSRHTHGKRPYSGNDSVDDDVDDGDFKVPAYKARRLQSDKQKISQSVAYMNQRRNVMMQNELKEQKSKLESEVHLTRKYTKDDLPDRSLTNENVVVCLLKFAKKDTTIASQLVTSLLKGIIHGYQKKWSEPHNQEESKRLSGKLISIIDETFTRIMSDTKHATRGVMSVVLDTCLTFASELTSSRCVDKLYDVSNRSGLHSLGVLVLENSLSRGSFLMETEDPPLENSNIWVYLARLYRSLGFSEIVQGIFEEKLASVDVREALESEADGELKMASNKYQSIARNVQLGEVDEQQVDFIYEAYFNCMARMADWDSLKKALLDVNDVDEMWNDNWSKETLLPWLFRSELNGALSAKTKNVEPFMSNLKAWLGDREKSDYIKTNIGEELSMLHLVNKSIDRALEVSENNRKLFLEDWMQLPALSHNLIMDKCLQLQRLMDIESALAVLKACKLKTNDWFPNCIDLLQKWDSNPPLKSDSLAHWEIRTKYRAHFCAAVLKEWKNPEISNYESSYYLTLLDLALQHENGYVAKKVLQKGNRKKPLWIAGQSRAELLVAQKFVDLGSKLEKICTSWEKIDGLNKTANIDLHVKLVSQKHITEICKALHSVVSMNRDLYYEKLNEKEICWFHKHFPNIDLRDSGCFLMKLYEEGLNSLEVAVRIADETVGVNSKAELADTYLTLAKYCQQQSDTGRCLTVESKMIESLLRAMKFGSREARQLFPAILSLPNLDESHSQVFVEESEQVPVWMFLLWVNQILARTYTEARPTLEPLLRRLLREYPHAVQYQVMLCVRSSNNTPPFLESFRTFNNMAEDFVEAVKYVILPATTLSNYLMDIEKSISCKESTEGIITKWNNLEQVVDALFSEDANRLKGSLYVDFQNKNKALGRELRILLDKRPLRVDDDSYSLFKKTLCDSRLWKMDSPQRLSSFSTYFKHYPSSPAFRIEVPGQYSGDSMPIPDKIVKISRFSERVTVMKSVRKPVKMSVIGNDGIEYGFLVKQGEDLRQDQRIMQTFRQMDSFLTLDNVNSPVMKYSLKTYNVIPFTPRLGLISWVDDSTSLEAFIKSCLDRREKEQFEKTIVNHLKWLPSGASQKHQYQNLYTEVSRENAVSNFRKNVLSLPQDILRRGILELSQSAESYHYLRTQFGTSLAAMSVCHWLVGIGDRHLNNSLLCLGTGQLCGIDFGHAFGSATEILSIPELLPFRLTPQMLNLFEPFRVTGLIKESMCRCLEILRKRKLFIMASIDVFIHEPLMDWAEQAKYCAILNGVDITETDFNSLPMEKIERAREKLDGANPVLVMAKDLKSGHGSKSYYKCVLSMLEGEKGSLRNSKAKDGLSAREQVECLIDLATDEHILGKSYCGLNAWV